MSEVQDSRLIFVSDVDGKRANYRCSCGNTKVIWKNNVNSGHTKSCGCYRAECTKKRSTTHGHKAGGKRSKTYVTWVNMKSRCYNEKTKSYPDYGGRGIKVCRRWLNSFENFLADMGEPKRGETIERKRVNGNYCPSNCIWLPKSKQNSNKRNVKPITAFGKTQNLAEWARELGIGRPTLHYRLKRGVPPEIAFSTTAYLKYPSSDK